MTSQETTPEEEAKKKSFRELFREVCRLIVVLVVVMGIGIVTFFILNGFSLADYNLYFYIFWYPLALVAIIIWNKLVEKRNLRDYIGNKPRWPEEGSRLFYILYFIGFMIVIIGWIVLLCMGPSYASVIISDPLMFVFKLTHSCIGAPFIEEYLFRGCIYERSKDVWQDSGWYISIKKRYFRGDDNEENEKNEKELSLLRITYAGLFSSILFGLWHLNVFQAIYTFFGGLIFVKTKREWGDTLIVPIILHFSWNFMAQVVVFTSFPWLMDLMNYLISLI